MSFNLNKNESNDSGHKTGPASKKSGFNLSKSDNDEETVSSIDAPLKEKRKTVYWIYALLALAVVGVAAWILTDLGADAEKPARDTSLNVRAAVIDTVTADTTLAMRPAGSSRERALPTDDSSSKSAMEVPAKSEKAVEEAGSGKSAEETQSSMTAEPIQKGSSSTGKLVFAASFNAGEIIPRLKANNLPAAIRNKLKIDPKVQVIVLGYASSEGDIAINQTISQARADAYKKILIQKGISENSITATGRGIENPIANNDTDSGRRKNRRVEVSY